jgi:hypothetical protein
MLPTECAETNSEQRLRRFGASGVTPLIVGRLLKRAAAFNRGPSRAGAVNVTRRLFLLGLLLFLVVIVIVWKFMAPGEDFLPGFAPAPDPAGDDPWNVQRSLRTVVRNRYVSRQGSGGPLQLKRAAAFLY